MPNPIRDNYLICGPDNAGTQILSFIQPGKVLSYQDSKKVPRYYNGYNFTPIYSQDGEIDIEAETDTGEIFTYRDILLWTPGKLNSEHPLTATNASVNMGYVGSDFVDKTLGNRIIGFPFLVEKKTNSTDKFKVSAYNTCCAFLKYHSISGLVLKAFIQGFGVNMSEEDFIGQRVAIAFEGDSKVLGFNEMNEQVIINDTFEDIGDNVVDLINKTKEIFGTVNSIIGSLATITLETPIPNTGPPYQPPKSQAANAAKVKMMAIPNAKIRFIPLSSVKFEGGTLTDKFELLPYQKNFTYDFVYLKDFCIGPFYTITSTIETDITQQLEKYKFIVQYEREYDIGPNKMGLGIASAIFGE